MRNNCKETIKKKKRKKFKFINNTCFTYCVMYIFYLLLYAIACDACECVYSIRVFGVCVHYVVFLIEFYYSAPYCFGWIFYVSCMVLSLSFREKK
eukprot:414995_1